jgi:flagellar biosynthesis/type III secretory pathway protein FliH
MDKFHQEASAVEQKVKDLQERVSHLMIDILRHVMPKSEEGNNEAVVNVVKGIEEDIKQLLRCAPIDCDPRSLLMIL